MNSVKGPCGPEAGKPVSDPDKVCCMATFGLDIAVTVRLFSAEAVA